MVTFAKKFQSHINQTSSIKSLKDTSDVSEPLFGQAELYGFKKQGKTNLFLSSFVDTNFLFDCLFTWAPLIYM